MRLGKTEQLNAAFYNDVRPKRLGDLHQRMKFVMKALDEARGWQTSEPDPEFDEFYPDLVDGLIELEREVKFYRPAEPPLASRAIPRSARPPRRKAKS